MEEEDGLGVKITKKTKIVVSVLDIIILLLIIFHFVIGDLPALSSLGQDKILILFSILISITGYILSFKYDGIGGLIILYGFMLFWIVNVTHNYEYHFQWITAGSPLSGVMHLFIWKRISKKKF